MVLRWREVVKGEKGEIKKTEDSPALIEVENFDFDTDHSECFLSQDINLGNISINNHNQAQGRCAAEQPEVGPKGEKR